jgi:hypothetical protein
MWLTRWSPAFSVAFRNSLAGQISTFPASPTNYAGSSTMPKPHPELAGALSSMLARIDAWLREGGYEGRPVRMFLAGGMAVNYHCGSRYTEDVDATFSARLLLPAREMTVDYVRSDGTPALLYFDANYNDTFALMHPDYRDDALEWTGIGNEDRLVHLYVLTPIDLAVSKISRSSEQDLEDIRSLAEASGFSSDELRGRALEALDYYVGNTVWVRDTIERVCDSLD